MHWFAVTTMVYVRIFYSVIVPTVVDYRDEISVEDMRNALDNVDGEKPTQRLFAEIT